ncbi:MAG: ferredoxin family protein [Phycisphaerae bacterium]
MSKLDGLNLRVVLYEGPGSAALPDEERFETLAALLDKGYDVSRRLDDPVTPASDRWEETQNESCALLLMGRFNGSGPPGPPESNNGGEHRVCDITGLDAKQVVHRAAGVAGELKARNKADWKPWFPVIDYDRCTNCMQCLTFCLFDVYGVDEGEQIRVQHNDHCKTDCPACSRVCPEVAILFPKYGKGPINGDEVRDEDVQREAMKVDVSALLGGDIYQSLKKRSSEAKQRFSTERDESRALLERRRCLKKLGKELDIPSEVLMSLPSSGDIQERAERARAKMAKRMERSQTVRDQRSTATEEEWGI